MAEMRGKQVRIDKLTHEMATLKRLKFAAASEAYTGERKQLLFETIETDLEALSVEIEKLVPTAPVEGEKHKPKRAALPASLPRRDVHHEPDSTSCSCGCQL
jgi:transposase